MSKVIGSPEEPDEELRQLVDGLIDGALSVEEQARLEERLRDDPDAAEFCAQRMKFDAELAECMNPTRFELVQSRRFVVEGRGEDRRVMVKQTQEAHIGRKGEVQVLPERTASSKGKGRSHAHYIPLILVGLVLIAVGWLASEQLQKEDVSESQGPAVPASVTSLWHRPPKNDEDLKYWLQNMVWGHDFETAEISMATGLKESEVLDALERFDIGAHNKPPRASERLMTLPYPGGRHPRLGNIAETINPQRETKVSVFAPWEEGGYVVLDLPEALNISNTFFYLAHTHKTTIWERQNIVLPPQEWVRKSDGQLESERRLPNGIVFSTRVRPTSEAVLLDFTLFNGSGGPLRDIKVQKCVLLGRAAGFEPQEKEDIRIIGDYIAAGSKSGKRWLIYSWGDRAGKWSSRTRPCIHSDPQIPLCRKGETVRLRGWLSFYEGDNVEEEVARIDATGWQEE